MILKHGTVSIVADVKIVYNRKKNTTWKGIGFFMVKDEVLRALENSRGLRISGGRLAQELGVSRAAVWKAIESLRAEGMQIASTPGGGYCLPASDDSLTAPGVSALLHTHCFGHDLIVLPETDSTNTAIKQHYAATKGEGFTFIAERQTAGRGRLGRCFHSSSGLGLYLSVLLRPKMPLEHLNFLTIAAAVAVCQTIETCCGLCPQIKWVNDVLLDGRKICGILTEASIEGETGCIDYAIVGIGVNFRLDRESLPPDVQAGAGALADFTDELPRRAVLAAELLNQHETLYDHLCAGRTDEVLAPYRKRLSYLDQPIRVLAPAGAYDAICRGVNDAGNLLVERPDGTRETLQSGEISTRPLV